MKIDLQFDFSLLLIISSFVSFTNPSPLPSISPLLGIAPQEEKYFKTEIINCRDGSKKFTKSQLNDDFCDCSDGTDEPDCCDGSDEYDRKVKCPNTCQEVGKAAKGNLKGKIKTYRKGITVRKQDIQKAIKAMAKDESELSKLKSEEKVLQRLVDKLKASKEKTEKEEEKERQEKENKKQEDALEKVSNENYEAEAKSDGTEEISPKSSGDDVIVLPHEPPQDQHERDEHENNEGLSKEEMGLLVDSCWTGEKSGNHIEEINEMTRVDMMRIMITVFQK